MASILDTVDQRTRLAGHNRLELLLFKLGQRQLFGINVFKVKEVIRRPSLTKIPGAHPAVCGVAHMRGQTISVVDLSMAVGKMPVAEDEDAFVIITEYNRKVQGFLVRSVDRIINVNWEKMHAPPKGSGNVSYLTAVTRIDEQLVEILDVEKIMAEIVGQTVEVSDKIKDDHEDDKTSSKKILIVDDSLIARKQIKRTLDQINIDSLMAQNGAEALRLLQSLAEDGGIDKHISLVISDVEMPEMDGYTLTTEIRGDPDLSHVYVMLHTSLSGVFNNAMVKKVGANKFIAKFNADELATGVFEALDDLNEL
ncbi:Chemotaxis protein CheV [hydrothermal vent metagenome]|uniref:Chemotaxis protein CheV n=1 Tax=hydrothermal vent metagenome TaxID=652676 RepID=A0A3B0Y2K4_9ZZZZ